MAQREPAKCDDNDSVARRDDRITIARCPDREACTIVDTAKLQETKGKVSFDGLAPRFISAGRRHVLAVGPFDRWEAELALEQVTQRALPALLEGVRIDAGDGYDDAR